MNDFALIAEGSVSPLKHHSAKPKVVFSLIMEWEQMREWKKYADLCTSAVKMKDKGCKRLSDLTGACMSLLSL